MRILRAIGDFFRDLFSGEPLAVIIAVVFLILLALPLTFWIIDVRKKRRERDKRKGPRGGGRPGNRG